MTSERDTTPTDPSWRDDDISDEGAGADTRLDRDPGPGELPSDPGVQAERQAEGVVAEYDHE